MMRRSASTRAAAVACVGLLFLLVVTSAAAGFKSGRYAGTTSQGTEISFKATKVSVKKFSYSVDIECDDGTHPSTWEGAKAPIGDKGRFKAEFVTDDEDATITSVVSGKLKRRSGSGTIETAGTLPGGWECHSSATWSAERR